MWAPLGTLSWDGCRVLRAFQGFLGSRDRVPPQGGQLARTRPEDQAQGARRANIPSRCHMWYDHVTCNVSPCLCVSVCGPPFPVALYFQGALFSAMPKVKCGCGAMVADTDNAQ